MINCCLIFSLDLCYINTENPSTWAKALTEIIAEDIAGKTAEIIVFPLRNTSIELTAVNNTIEGHGAVVHIYTKLPEGDNYERDLSGHTSRRLLNGDGVIDCVQAIGSTNPVITLILPAIQA